MLLHGIMLQHVGHDIRQVLLRHQLFLVAQLNDTFRHFAGLLGRQFQTQFLQVLEDIGLPAVFAQGILSLTAETFGQKVVAIKVGLVVPVGMHTGHLRKHTLARNRTVGRNRDAGIAFHHPAHFVQPAFVNICLCIELVFQYHLHTGQRGIPCPLAQAVDRGMDTPATAQHGSQHVGNGQVVIVMGMEVEMHARITFHHLADVTQQIQWIQDAQRIRQHETPDFRIFQSIHQCKDIVRRMLHAIAPVFQIDVYGNAQFFGIIQRTTDVGHVLLQRFLQLVRTMVFRTLTQQIDVFTPASMNPIQRSVSVYKPQNFHPVEPPGLARPLANATHCIHLPLGYPSRSHLYAIHVQVLQQRTGYHQLFMRHETYATGLFPVAQGRVHDFYLHRIRFHP